MFKGMVGSWTLVGIGLLVGCLVLGAFFGEQLGGNVLALMGAGLAVVLGGIGSIVGVGVAGEKLQESLPKTRTTSAVYSPCKLFPEPRAFTDSWWRSLP